MGFYLLENSPVNGTQWQQWAYPRRGIYGKLSGTVIMHTSESALDVIGDDSGAEDVARFIANRTGSFGSYHDIVDSNSIIEMAPFEYETWQDSETNNWAVGISAACRTTDWATMGDAKREGYYRNLAWCAADFVKYMRTKGIEVPRVRITGAQARARVPGFCAHGDSGLFRTDPGADFDWARFFRYTNEALNTEPKEWDELATREEVKTAVREVLAEKNVLDAIALNLLLANVMLIDPVTGQPNGSTNLATKISWMAYLHQTSGTRELQALDKLNQLIEALIPAEEPPAEPTV